MGHDSIPNGTPNGIARALIDAAGDGLVAINRQGRIVVFNPAAGRIFGVDPAQMIGQRLERLFPPELAAAHQQYVARYFEGEGRGAMGTTVKAMGGRADDTTVPLEISLSATETEGEQLVVASIRDVSSRHEKERQNRELVAQLSQAQKMEAMGTLSAGVAHDFNNMLGAIMGYASAMARELDQSPRHREDAQQILTIARRAKRLTDKLLAFSRQSDTKVEVFSVNRVIRDVVSLLSRTIPKNIVLKTKLARDINVEGDRTQLEQALLNLCLNARDAMPDGGEVSIETSRLELTATDAAALGLSPGPYNRIVVRDNGSGMDGETLRRAFDPFFSTKPAGEGSGLGLSLVYSAINNQGGQVKLASQPGQGTRVTAYLPASAGRPRSDSSSMPSLASRQVPGKGERILLVDDERHLRDMAKRLLEGLGYRVELAESGEEAESYYRKNHQNIDLVILDVVLVGLSGVETLERLREINRDVRVLVSSGHNRDGEPRDLLQRGVCGFIQKPYGIDEVSTAIQKALTWESPRQLS